MCCKYLSHFIWQNRGIKIPEQTKPGGQFRNQPPVNTAVGAKKHVWQKKSNFTTVSVDCSMTRMSRGVTSDLIAIVQDLHYHPDLLKACRQELLFQLDFRKSTTRFHALSAPLTFHLKDGLNLNRADHSPVWQKVFWRWSVFRKPCIFILSKNLFMYDGRVRWTTQA